MICNNARATFADDHYSLTIPENKQAEKDAVLKQAVEKYNGYVHVEISKVRKPKSVEGNRLFHGLVTEYYISGLHSCASWQELKNQLKYQFGAGFIHTIKLPDGKEYGILKSVAEYSMHELYELTNGTIADMLIQGVDSAKFKEILAKIKYEVH
jgi:hypothetical protein